MRVLENSPASTVGPLNLRFGPSLLRRSHMLVLMVPTVATFAMTLPLLWWCEGRSLSALAESMGAALTEGDVWDRVQVWTMFLLAPVVVAMVMAMRAARLRLSPFGLQGHVSKWSGIGLQKLTTGRISLPWERIESVALVSRGQRMNGIGHLKTARLIIRTRDGDVTLAPFNWVAESGADHRLTLREAMSGGRASAAEWLSRSPLVLALQARGFTVRPELTAKGTPEIRDFDLSSHRGLVAQMIVMAVAGVYALVDTFATGPYHALQAVPFAPFAVAAVIGSALAVVLGRGAPAKERVGVGVLALAALVAAVHPALLRVNAWTGAERVVPYTVSAPGRLRSPEAALPDIDLSHMNMPEYWEAHPPGTEHPMVLVQGAAGFHQWDSRPLFEQVRAFYAEIDG